MTNGSISATLVSKHSWNVRNEQWYSGISYTDLGGNWTDTRNGYLVTGQTHLVNDQRDAHISATNIEWLLPEAVLIQFISPDNEHYVLETCREL
jgi:hypothetical protein